MQPPKGNENEEDEKEEQPVPDDLRVPLAACESPRRPAGHVCSCTEDEVNLNCEALRQTTARSLRVPPVSLPLPLDTLAGVHILFTGVIPFDHTEPSNKITHVVINNSSVNSSPRTKRNAC